MGSKGSQTQQTQQQTQQNQQQSTSYTPNEAALSRYNEILAGLSNLPTGSYQGELTAPINAQQMAGVGNVNQYAGAAQPGIANAMGAVQGASQPLSAAQIQQYMSPYTQNVVDTTMAAMNLQNQQGLSALTGNAAAQNALGGNRVGIAQSNYLTDQNTKNAPIIAGIYDKAYQSGLGVANQQFQQNPMQAAQLYGGLALQGQQAGLQGAQAQVGVGTLMQQTQQAQDTAALQNWLLPYGQYGSMSQIATGVGSQMGGSGTSYGTSSGTSSGNSATTPAAPNPWSQILGLGIAGLGAFSDKRLKEDVQKVGELTDGQAIYRYRFKGSPKWEIGLIAQEVERDHPEAVTRGVGNMRMVDYKAATDDSVKRWRGGAVAGFAAGGSPIMPMPSVMTSLPGVAAPQATDWRSNLKFFDPKSHDMKFMDAPKQQDNAMSSGQMAGVAGGIKNLWDKGSDFFSGVPAPLENYAPAQDITNSNYAVGPESPDFYSAGAWAGPYADGGAVPLPRSRPGWSETGYPKPPGKPDLPLVEGYPPPPSAPVSGVANDWRTIYGPRESYRPSVTEFEVPGPYSVKDHALAVARSIFEGDKYREMMARGRSSRNPLYDKITYPLYAPGFADGGVPTLSGVGGGFVPEGPELPVDMFADRFAALPQENIPLPPPRPPTAGFAPAPAAPAASPPMDRYTRAIANMESSNDYSEVGPQTRTGDRAYGKYQVMGANIPEWTLAVLGRAMTAPEFLADPKAQDQVFQAKFGTYKDKYGPSGAARAWFAGEGGMNDPNRKDILGTSVASYENKFNTAAGLGPQNTVAGGSSVTPAPVASLPPEAPAPDVVAGVGAGDDALPQNAQLAQGPVPSGVAPRAGFLNMSEEARLGMIAAGLGMMSSRSPYLGVGIGEGGLTGLKAYKDARGSRRLEEQARLAQSKLDLQESRLEEQRRHSRQKETLEASRPFKIGMDQMGRDVFGIRSKDGNIIPLDPVTGRPVEAPAAMPPVAPGAPPPATPGVDPNIPMTGDTTLPPGAQPVSGRLGLDDPIAVAFNETALEGLDAATANRVKAVAEGRMPAMALRGRNDVYNRMIMDKVSAYNPAYDQTVFASRQRTANEFKNGVAGRNLTATKTLAGHLEDLHKLANELDNSGVPMWNRAKQMAGRETGISPEYQEKIKKYELQAKVVADEAAKVFAGSQSALADRQHWEQLFDVSHSKTAQMAAVKQLVRQVDSRLEALASQYNNGMMTSRQPSDLIDKKFRDIFDKLRDASTDEKKVEAKELNAQDKQAIEWAKKNKDDARAKAILKKHGMD